MKLKLISLVYALMVSTTSFAQEMEDNTMSQMIHLPKSINYGYAFDGDWRISEITKHPYLNVQFKGDCIVNNTAWASNDLVIEIYFLLHNKNYSLDNLPEKAYATIELGKIESRGSVGPIEFNFNKTEQLEFAGDRYKLILVLKDLSKRNPILNYKIFHEAIQISGGTQNEITLP